LIDIPAMRRAGLSIATPDAHPLVLRIADWQTQRRGGSGAVRDVCELLLHSQGKLRDIYNEYLTCL
jgi:3-deoxy-D-manno-octulosonate 8-phosphate phosphatase (KDO 8-P phosphatase)